jgi:hypothetical protein
VTTRVAVIAGLYGFPPVDDARSSVISVGVLEYKFLTGCKLMLDI